MNTIIGFIILGVCLLAGAFILAAAISGAAAALKESAPQPLQQPTLKYLTEFDAADYIGVSLKELDYMRAEGLLDGSFMAVTSLEQTGEEEYTDVVDGVEELKTRPIMSNVTRFIFNCQLLDECVLALINDGNHVNPYRRPNQQQKKGAQKNSQKKKKAAVTDISEAETAAADTAADVAEVQDNANQPAEAPAEKPNPHLSDPQDTPAAESAQPAEDAQKSGVAYSDNNSGASYEPSPAYNPDARTTDFPIVKPSAKVVSRPKITIVQQDDDGSVDIMSAGKPQKPRK
ncbi:MAG: hypothetical protein E7559_00060 [Ruminococcaceae bacterium]|nr:hypothetical protein [Oscillospiraceae bacterium]